MMRMLMNTHDCDTNVDCKIIELEMPDRDTENNVFVFKYVDGSVLEVDSALDALKVMAGYMRESYIFTVLYIRDIDMSMCDRLRKLYCSRASLRPLVVTLAMTFDGSITECPDETGQGFNYNYITGVMRDAQNKR